MSYLDSATRIKIGKHIQSRDIYMQCAGFYGYCILNLCDVHGLDVGGYHFMDLTGNGIELQGYLGGYDWDEEDGIDIMYDDMGIDIDYSGSLIINGVDLI
jgi:hypothetical protein